MTWHVRLFLQKLAVISVQVHGKARDVSISHSANVYEIRTRAPIRRAASTDANNIGIVCATGTLE